jgi:tetratricopeptide (TPR) repeat protein
MMSETPDSSRRLLEQADERYDAGDHAAARLLYEQALPLCEQAAGPNHPDTARVFHGLGRTLLELGDYAAARRPLERALAIRGQALGPGHPDTAASAQALGDLLFDLGEFDRGHELTEQALRVREQALGRDHPDTIESLKNLALQIAYRGDRQRAGQLLEQALAGCRQSLGEDHLTTVKVLNGLGVVWAADERTRPRARAAYEEALAIGQRLLGPDHRYTLLALGNLGTLLADMNEDGVAITLLRESLARHERIVGPEHARVSFVLVNLAGVYQKTKQYQAARPLLERALSIREGALGARHPQTIACLRQLVSLLGTLHQQGDARAMAIAMPLHTCLMALEAGAGTPAEANRLMPGAFLDPDQAAGQLRRLIAGLEAERARAAKAEAGRSDLDTAERLAREAGDLYGQGDYPAAQTRLEQALVLREGVLGTDDLDHIGLLKQLARVHEAQGHYTAVLPLVQRVADIHARVLGRAHPLTALAFTELASQMSEEYDLVTALPIFERAFQGTAEARGADDPMVQIMRRSLDQLQAMAPQPKGEAPARSRSEKWEAALASLSPERLALLDGLEAVDWHSVQHAYGPADDVPYFLRLLLTDDEPVRASAWDHLYNSLLHQGSVYEASAYAVPFLLRLLVAGGPPGAVEVLGFLAGLAGIDPFLSGASEDEEAAGPEEQEDDQGTEDIPHDEALRQALASGLPLYRRLVSDADPEVQALARRMLARLAGWQERLR